MKTPIRVGAHIEGVHWVAEYTAATHEIRVFREGHAFETIAAPPALLGEEEEAGSASDAASRAEDAAVLAVLRQYVAEREAEE
ncbi:hypothetical protein B0G62_10544 [Paraburkholderia eburnea]|uniref:Uncharacterized protein n=1 Tax=Paraburkholderia eburnea TaxID=1189126 RepID=A0A2S4MBG0_9BURK|nr:hypothetical protein [Paraburkholderia eburnea]POR52076.1 hypothetical protein B0G62_10544 [Paraburkholderia eburnea]PRZ22967.1 hypothetical protein BX588_10544 [Paraburkholderia eburnea]